MASLKIKYAAIIISSLIAGGLISVTAWQYVNSSQKTVQTEQKAPERKVLFWYDPMKPDTKFDKPGKSPFMDMDLVPKYADDSGDKSSGGIRIDPTQVQNLGLKTQKVTRGMLNYSQTIPANVSYNEYQFVIVQARSDGFVEKVYPMTIGDHVKKGTPLIDITIPDWVEAQSEFLLLSSTGGTSTQIKGVLERLRLAATWYSFSSFTGGCRLLPAVEQRSALCNCQNPSPCNRQNGISGRYCERCGPKRSSKLCRGS